MNKILYGGGNCSLKGDDIIGLQINFSGNIHMVDKTPPNFHIIARNNTILIFSSGTANKLEDLFEYKGFFKINSVIAVSRTLKKVRCRIELVMDHANLLKTKSEDLDIRSEAINASYTHKAKVAKTKIAEGHIENLNCNGEFYHKDGTPYYGYYHVHLDTEMAMTGAAHNKDSKILFIKKHDKIISTGKKGMRKLPRLGRR